MKFRLATFRYKEAAAARTQLGFIIDDVAPSPSIDPARDMVDLYGYTSMAVAALQTQAREIEALTREVRALRRELERERGDRRPRQRSVAPASAAWLSPRQGLVSSGG